MAQGRNRARVKRNVPNWFTLGNALCGLSAIMCAAAGFNLGWSVLLLLLSMVFDALDGRVARMTGVTSNLGAQLDSLSDAISFGVAPAFVLFSLLRGHVNAVALWGTCAIYLACVLWRLARFNVETPDDSEDSHLWFSGMPSTGGAFVVGLSVLASYLLGAGALLSYAICLGVLFASALMISRVRFPHINWLVRLVRRRD